tara:strand:- start:175 stop:741 length:567 start_codon:yes stop_codon:yes gene_type:complete
MAIRIISGNLKGKKINYLKNSNTRPLKDSVKENIFNILMHSNYIKIKLDGSKVLDLYSGVGSFGIECISRGAEKVTFVEKDNLALMILKKNLKNLSIIDKAKIFNDKAERVLNNKLVKKFDIFFLDPPFNDDEYMKNLILIKKENLFAADHVVIIHREKGSVDNLSKIINVIDIKEYGRSKIIFSNFN